jgi:hypothetical protein
MKRYLIAIGLLLTLGSAGWFWYHKSPLSSDDSLISHFERHRPAFEELVRMVHDDSNLLTVGEDYVSIIGNPAWRSDREEGFSTKRWNEYKVLFAQLDIHRISVEAGIIYIVTGSTASTDLDGSYERIVISKDYAYSKNLPMPLIQSLDDADFNTTRHLYKRIDENWYLFFDFGVSKPE